MIHTISALLIFLAMLPSTLQAQPQRKGKVYTDIRGDRIYLPIGDLAFADEVVSYERGTPHGPEGYSDPQKALGPPNFLPQESDLDKGECLCLGCGGTVVLKFTDNALIDVEGPDLYIFEVGTVVEATRLAISENGNDWVEIGRIDGGTAAIDIARFVPAGRAYRYVRLTDLKSECRQAPPGADIDAVAAIGSALQFAVDRAIRFDYDSAELQPEGIAALQQIALKLRDYPGAKVVIEGHTDSIGTDGYNQTLSEKRAAAVRDYLIMREGLTGALIQIKGYGRSRPAASNSTDEGRARNRRVEITAAPPEEDR
jgi:outer membrane protein OmpA-like peptidoglycan-associated protein